MKGEGKADMSMDKKMSGMKVLHGKTMGHPGAGPSSGGKVDKRPHMMKGC